MKILSATGVFFLRIYRIIALLSWSIVITSVAFICTVFRKEAVAVRRAAYFTQVWARVCARIMNVTIDVRGTVPENGALVVSNHTGPFDILVNSSVFPVRFAPKKELKYTPVLGQIVAASRPVWIDRKRRLEAKKTAQEITRTIGLGVNMLVYPEGTSTDGRHGILPFKSTAFDAAEFTKCDVIKVLLFFETPSDPGKSSAWYDDSTLGAYLWRALGLKKVVSTVYIIGVTSIQSGEDRKSMAKRIHHEMSEEYAKIL